MHRLKCQTQRWVRRCLVPPRRRFAFLEACTNGENQQDVEEPIQNRLLAWGGRRRGKLPRDQADHVVERVAGGGRQPDDRRKRLQKALPNVT